MLRKLGLSLVLLSTLTTPVQAIEFKAEGEWLWGFGGVESSFIKNNNGGNDVFDARQRLRLQLEATVSESLSGTLRIQIGDVAFGNADEGGALGADGKIVKVRDAYLDWQVPNTDLHLRMGLQGIVLPNVAGGSAILDEQTAGIVASWKLHENIGLTAFWLRPFNDNYVGYSRSQSSSTDGTPHLLDNIDYFGLSLPLHFQGIAITPWTMVGAVGRNALLPQTAAGEEIAAPILEYTMPLSFTQGNVVDNSFNTKGTAYATQAYFGLPIAITLLDPWNFEVDFNYGYSSGWGRYSIQDRLNNQHRADSQRAGWLVKALAEYKMSWGTPGIFGWYASGDDGDISNGSERMPSIMPTSTFTSFMQDGENGWSVANGYDIMLSYAGTWGIGLQVKDVQFTEQLRHTIRVAYWGGTNNVDMIRYTASPQSWRQEGGLYLTSQDYLVEFNIDTTWQIYDNLEAVVELGYIINGIDSNAWGKNAHEACLQSSDAWKAALIFKYSF